MSYRLAPAFQSHRSLSTPKYEPPVQRILGDVANDDVAMERLRPLLQSSLEATFLPEILAEKLQLPAQEPLVLAGFLVTVDGKPELVDTLKRVSDSTSWWERFFFGNLEKAIWKLHAWFGESLTYTLLQRRAECLDGSDTSKAAPDWATCQEAVSKQLREISESLPESAQTELGLACLPFLKLVVRRAKEVLRRLESHCQFADWEFQTHWLPERLRPRRNRSRDAFFRLPKHEKARRLWRWKTGCAALHRANKPVASVVKEGFLKRSASIAPQQSDGESSPKTATSHVGIPEVLAIPLVEPVASRFFPPSALSAKDGQQTRA